MRVSANIATYPPRKQSLLKMLDSIYSQFDVIRVYLNGYNEPPAFDDPHNKMVWLMGDDLTDNGKFFALDHIKEDEYYFTLDDDLIYSADYRDVTIENIIRFNCIVTYHGRELLGTGRDYYKGHRSHRCLDRVTGNYSIDVAGTGVTAFDTRYFHPKELAHHPKQKMSDLLFSFEAATQGAKIMVCEHGYGWITHIHNDETIYETETAKGITVQNQIADLIYGLRN